MIINAIITYFPFFIKNDKIPINGDCTIYQSLLNKL